MPADLAVPIGMEGVITNIFLAENDEEKKVVEFLTDTFHVFDDIDFLE